MFPVVGVGASAGGLEAFRRLFRDMPPDCGIAFVLIQHLDPTRESLTVELVGSYTRMMVVPAEDGLRVEANCVYVIPPDKYLSIHDRRLRLSTPTEPRGLRRAVDFFFRSLADERRERAIGIVLSGAGTDGTLGLQAIQALGGRTMAQDPETAEHDGMPRSAIAAGCVDDILPAERMAEALLTHVRRSAHGSVGERPWEREGTTSLSSIVALLQARGEFDFRSYKTGTVGRRIERRMSLRQIGTMPAYLALLESDPIELAALHKDLLINATSFFRDPIAWRTLQERAVRPLVAAKAADAPVRVWVPACATGEEAYSIAMVLIEEMRLAGKVGPLQVFASDVDVEGLKTARTGLFPPSTSTQVSRERLNQFFKPTEQGYEVVQDLREVTIFSPQNMLHDPPFAKLDLISCRNLLIYLEPDAQARILTLLHFALLEGGFLFLGSADGIGSPRNLFEPVSKKWRIYRRIGAAPRDPAAFPIAATAGAKAAGRPTSSPPYAGRLAMLAERQLLERHGPASVVVNGTGEVLHFHGETDDYLIHPAGAATRDLIAIARRSLRSPLREVVRKAIQERVRVVRNGIELRPGGTCRCVTISAEPLVAPREAEPAWLVSFELEPEATTSDRSESHAPAERVGYDVALVRQLEDELQSTRNDLQLNIEDLRQANGELQSSNEELETSKEELMSVNEELQSSNEELETSKEELQLMNEELGTANSDRASKIMELEATNDDLENLLVSTNIATVFLDPSLRIRRFTPAAIRLFSLIPGDVGRPIQDIVQKFADPLLLSDVEAVLREPATRDTEVLSQDGRWYVRQVLPYRTHDERMEGVVITFSDVAAEAVQRARRYAESIVDTVREPLLVLDEDMRVCSANQSFYSTFAASPQTTVGESLYDIGNHGWDVPELRVLLARVLSEGHVLNDLEIERDFGGIGTRTLVLNARAIVNRDDPGLILLAMEDRTERKHAERALERSEALKQSDALVRERQAELAHALRISTIGEMASSLAHELNQPLSSIANRVEACAEYVRSGRVNSTDFLELLEKASSEALRAGSIVEHLRSFIQQREPRFEPTDLGEIARAIPRLFECELRLAGITLQLDSGSDPLPIHADRIQIEQVVVNLVQNAIDAMGEAPADPRTIQLRTRRVNEQAELSVADSGPGLPSDATERLFAPFFTTKPKGLGMGLAISRSIIEAHQGRIWVDCPADGRPGATFCVTLPVSPAPIRNGEGT